MVWQMAMGWGWRGRVAGWDWRAGGGWARGVGLGVSEGEGAVVVGDAEVGEAHEVDGGGSGGEPEVVGGDAAVGDASGLVAGEPRDGAFDHGAVLLVGALGGGLGPAGLVGLSAAVVLVDGDAAPGRGGGAAGAQGTGVALSAEAGRAGFDGLGVPGGAGHGLRVGVDGEVVSGEAPGDARLGVDGLDGGVVAGGRERVERLARRVGRVGQHQPHEPLSVRGVRVSVSAVSVSAVVSAVSVVLWGAVGSCWSRRGPTRASDVSAVVSSAAVMSPVSGSAQMWAL